MISIFGSLADQSIFSSQCHTDHQLTLNIQYVYSFDHIFAGHIVLLLWQWYKVNKSSSILSNNSVTLSLFLPKDSWEMVGKKKGVSGQKETSQAETGEEGKENREKGGEKDVARRRGGAPRKGRGASRGRECKCIIFLHYFIF